MTNETVLLRKVHSGSTRIYISKEALATVLNNRDFQVDVCDETLHNEWGFDCSSDDGLLSDYKYRTLRAVDVTQNIEIARAVRNLFTTPATPSEDELGLIKF
jgi:hypothetical protein